MAAAGPSSSADSAVIRIIAPAPTAARDHDSVFESVAALADV
jgi:hypothetical protein